MATTAQTIIDAAYRKIGIQSPDSEEDAFALEALNNMISLWGAALLPPSITSTNHLLTIGVLEYTIGTGGTIDSERPLYIANAHIRDASTGDDVPLKILSGEEFNAITDKDESGTPTGLYYLAEYPLGKIFLNKAPGATDTLYIEYWGNFTELEALSTEVVLPAEYKKALIYNLAVELAEDNSIELPPSVYRAAEFAQILIARIVAASRIPAKTEFPVNMGGLVMPTAPSLKE
jgi:hypothetical protein